MDTTKIVTIDFETYYASDYSLSKMSTEAYIRDPRFQVIGVSIKVGDGKTHWVTENLPDVLKKLEGRTVVAHNAVFDCAILTWKYGVRPGYIIDTLSMSRPVTGLTVGGSLKALAERFGIGRKGDEVYKTLGKRKEDFTPEELARFGEYCRNDVELTYALLPHLLPTTTRQEMDLIDLVMRMYTDPVIELDKGILQAHLDKVLKAKSDLLASSGVESREDFMSNAKFAEKLKALGVEPPTKVSPTTGKETYAFAKTDQGMKDLLAHPDERVQALVSARLGLKSTIEETRTDAFLGIAKRGAMPIMLQYYGAVNTGRFSGGDKTNPQNLPRGGALRAAMKAPPGHKVIACDSSNIEARVLAWLAGEEKLVQSFRDKHDVYSEFATTVYAKPINKHDNPVERHVGKTCVLGLGYGVGHAKLQYSLANGQIKVVLPLEECKRIVDLYRSTYERIQALWRACQSAIESMHKGYDCVIGEGTQLQCTGDRRIRLPNGMYLRYPELRCVINDKGKTEYEYQRKRVFSRIYGGALTENIVQALARIVVCEQMLTIDKYLKRMHEKFGGLFRVVHMVHDEVVVVAPDEHAPLVKYMMEKVMSTPPAWASSLPVACEADFGQAYGDAK